MTGYSVTLKRGERMTLFDRDDYWCKGLGFSQHKSDAYKKYLDLMKRRKEGWGLSQIAMNFMERTNPDAPVEVAISNVGNA